jgi:hypothetical protein
MWMTLVFTYALFIPNTWQRAARVIGVMTVTPILLLLFIRLNYSGLAHPITEHSYMQQGVLDNVMVLLLSATTAIWGVYMVNTLRREAFEARQLGQYQLRQRLGAGGMGEVYLAEHMLLKRRCAVQVMRAEKTNDVATLARFEREFRANRRSGCVYHGLPGEGPAQATTNRRGLLERLMELPEAHAWSDGQAPLSGGMLLTRSATSRQSFDGADVVHAPPNTRRPFFHKVSPDAVIRRHSPRLRRGYRSVAH